MLNQCIAGIIMIIIIMTLEQWKVKRKIYKVLVISLKGKFYQVKLVYIAISTPGAFEKSSVEFLQMLRDLELEEKAGIMKPKR